MNKNTIIVLLVIIIIAFAGYVVMQPEGSNKMTNPATSSSTVSTVSEQTASGDVGNTTASKKSSIVWKLSSAGTSPTDESMTFTNVAVVINNTSYEIGKFAGSCSEVGASGGVDGKGLLTGELSAVQCWFAGGGDEIGVFAHEDGGFDILVGELSEGEDGAGLFRGDFKVKQTIQL